MKKILITATCLIGSTCAAFYALAMGKVPVLGSKQDNVGFYDYGNGLVNVSNVSNISHTILINAISRNPQCQLNAAGALNESTYQKVREVARQAQAAGCGPATNISASIKFDNFTLTLPSFEGAASVDEAIREYTKNLNEVKASNSRLYDFGNGLINLSQVKYINTQILINAISRNPQCQLNASGALNESTYQKVREVARQAQAAGCGPATNISASIKFDNFTLTLPSFEGAASVEEAIRSYQASKAKIR